MSGLYTKLSLANLAFFSQSHVNYCVRENDSSNGPLVLNVTNDFFFFGCCCWGLAMTNEHISASFTLHKNNASPVKRRIVSLHCFSCKVDIRVSTLVHVNSSSILH